MESEFRHFPLNWRRYSAFYLALASIVLFLPLPPSLPGDSSGLNSENGTILKADWEMSW